MEIIRCLLRYMDGPDHGGSEHLLLALHQLLQKVDSGIVVRREINAYVAGQKVVDLPLRSVVEVLDQRVGSREALTCIWPQIPWKRREQPAPGSH